MCYPIHFAYIHLFGYKRNMFDRAKGWLLWTMFNQLKLYSAQYTPYTELWQNDNTLSIIEYYVLSF